MKKDDKSAANGRRKFLEMVGKGGVSTGLLRASPLVAGMMANRYASAAEGDNKRVVFLFFPGGAPRGAWMPSSINQMNDCTRPYASVAEYCNFYSTEMGPGGDHGKSHFALGGRVTNTTLDAQLAASAMGSVTPYSALNLGVETGMTGDLIGRRNGQGIRPEDSTAAAYAQFFGSAPPPGEADAIYRKQKTALDANKEALAALSGKLGQEERERMDIHLGAIERIERRLMEATVFEPAEGCKEPDLPTSGAGFADKIKLQADMAVAALQCGLTNIVTIQVDDSQCDWRYDGSFSEGHHQTQHGRSRGDVVEITRYLSESAAYLIQRLIDTPDPAGGRLIDSTVFVQVTDMADGMSHSNSGAPNILATNMPGFTTGTVGGGGTNVALLNEVALGLGFASSIAAGTMSNFDPEGPALV